MKQTKKKLKGVSSKKDQNSQHAAIGFGVSLNKFEKKTGCRVPLLVEKCILYLDCPGTLAQDKLFLRPSSNVPELLEHISAEFEEDQDFEIPEDTDPHCVANLLRDYFAAMPPGLLNSDLDKFARACDSENIVEELRETFQSLSPAYYYTSLSLFEFLNKVVNHASENSMNSTILSMAWQPILISGKSKSKNMNIRNLVSTIIDNFDDIFPENDFDESEQGQKGIMSTLSLSMKKTSSKKFRETLIKMPFPSSDKKTGKEDIPPSPSQTDEDGIPVPPPQPKKKGKKRLPFKMNKKEHKIKRSKEELYQEIDECQFHLARALYDFGLVSTETIYLNFRKNDYLWITQESEESDWVEGWMEEDQGFFPLSYVERVLIPGVN
eukprot:TRINITY_DN6419_c0_g1_i1.p1 TRINITY_DN6419_c0_g1~~TRINITY_DN6419_c0_g1_i1.p1  ORF type:complete len:380 (-),score=93.61 TRINITY_DN6419_c0_g1_i1:26-1165(-)